MKKKLLAVMLMSVLAFTGCSSSTTTAPASSESDAAGASTETEAAESAASNSALEEHSVAGIQKKGKIVFATEAAYAPYAFKDADGNIVGFEKTIMEEVAAALGVEAEINDMAFDSVIPSVQSGLADVGIAAITPTAERAEAVNLTVKYWEGGQIALVRAEDAEKFATDEDLTGIVIGAQKGSYQQQVCDAFYAEGNTTRYLETVPTLVNDLKVGNVDVLIMDEINGKMYAQENEDLATGFMAQDMEGVDGGNAMALALGNDDLTEYINGLIEGWKEDGSLDQWFADAVALQEQLGVE